MIFLHWIVIFIEEEKNPVETRHARHRPKKDALMRNKQALVTFPLVILTCYAEVKNKFLI